MEYIKDLSNKYVKQNHKIGEVLFVDGLVDVSDPCYDRGTWCARYDVKVKPGKYCAFIDEVDFPSTWEYQDGDEKYYPEAVPGKKFTMHDIRVVTLTIFNSEYVRQYLNKEYNCYKLSDNIGVDAGLCGFYSHLPESLSDDEWNKLVDNLEENSNHNVCDCHHLNGVTVSSGFGDGVYKVYKLTVDRKVVGLQLVFA